MFFRVFYFSVGWFYRRIQATHGVPVAVLRNDGTFAPTYDANGNVTEYVALETRNSQLETVGNVVAHYQYDAFGNIVVQSGSLADSFSFRFSTKPYCAILDKVEFQLRIYAPVTGRWMSRDPIGEIGGLHLYGFVENNPANKIDKLGLSKCSTPCPKGAKTMGELLPLEAEILGVEKGCTLYRTNEQNGIPIPNGCGAEGGTKFPGTFLGLVDFTPCCNEHDKGYGTCGKSKTETDREFLRCMTGKCLILFFSPVLYGGCQTMALVYYGAVAIKGGEAYEAAQDGYCRWKQCCIRSDSAPSSSNYPCYWGNCWDWMR